MLTGRDLYVDFGMPARCMGNIIKWEFCYTVTSTGPVGPGPSLSEDTISIVILRRDNLTEEQYRIVKIYGIKVQMLSDHNGVKERDTVSCYSVDSHENVVIRQGDLLGFVNGERARILATSTFQQDGGMLKVYHVSMGQQHMNSGADYLRRVEVIPEHQFKSLNQSLTPVVRVILCKNYMIV